MHSEVHVSKKCEVHDLVCKHVTGCMEKHVPRFLILEALYVQRRNFAADALTERNVIS